MATDLETGATTPETAVSLPCLKIVGLHIKGLKSIGSLDLPGDGLGWKGPIPDFLMIGGINGSGKTTLLEFLAAAFARLPEVFEASGEQELPPALRVERARVDFQFMADNIDEEISFLIGDEAFLAENGQGLWYGFQHDPGHPPFGKYRHQLRPEYSEVLEDGVLASKLVDRGACPAVVYFPSADRTLSSPETAHKFAGKHEAAQRFVHRWEPPRAWADSLESRLYGVRWDDLNAREEGRDDEAHGFEAYSESFRRFFEGRKQLKWHRGELVVEMRSGTLHDLSELSSGEKQMILFLGELLHRWRPGSLILIDEPELHLHESYQTRLWEALVRWQGERGGQVIVATQSGHLFGIGDPGIKVLLSHWRSR